MLSGKMMRKVLDLKCRLHRAILVLLGILEVRMRLTETEP